MRDGQRAAPKIKDESCLGSAHLMGDGMGSEDEVSGVGGLAYV